MRRKEKRCGRPVDLRHPLDSSGPFVTQNRRSDLAEPSLIGGDAGKSGSEANAAGAIMMNFRSAKKSAILRQLVAATSGVLAMVPPSAPVHAQGVVKGKFGDWELRCEQPAGAAREQCALIQSVVAEDKANANLVVIILKTSDGKSRLMRVIAPLGVLLPNGLGLKIDDADIGRAGFVKCLPSGCVAEVTMDDKLIDQLKNGRTATYIIHQVPDEGIGLPLTLGGFKDGFAKLP